MIKFQPKNKRKISKTIQQRTKIHQSVIKKSDVQLTDILINGVQLPGYKKLTDHRKKKHRERYLSTSFCEIDGEKNEQEETPTLFKNTAIRTKLKSLEIQINITALRLEENPNQRKSSCQRQVPTNFEQFIKTSTFMYQKPKNQRCSTQTVFNWTQKTFKEKPNIEQSVRSHSTKNRTENPLWISQNNIKSNLLKKNLRITNNGSRLNNSKGFNDSLQAQRQDFLSLRKSEGTRDIPLILDTPKNDSYKSIFRQTAYSQKSKNKVCFSLRQRKQSRQSTIRNPIQRTKVALPDYEQQEVGNDI